jgi:hypothetical protein
MLTALFGITNDALSLVVSLLILFLVVLWLALVAWTYFDARRRLEDGFLIVCAAACSLVFPFVGSIVYSILRPPEFLADKRERELEIRAAELRLRQLEEQSCPNCERPIERTFLRCPSCRARIKDPCESCGKPIDPRWAICPYCEMPAPPAAPPERRPEKKRRAKPSAKAPARQPAEPVAPKPVRAATKQPAATGQTPASKRPAATTSEVSERQTRPARTSQRRTSSAGPPKQGE